MHKHFNVCFKLVCWNELVICVHIQYGIRAITVKYNGASYILTCKDYRKKCDKQNERDYRALTKVRNKLK